MLNKIWFTGQQNDNYQRYCDYLEANSGGVNFNEKNVKDYTSQGKKIMTVIEYMAMRLNKDGECDKIKDLKILKDAIEKRNLGAVSSEEKETLFKETVKFISRCNTKFGNHGRCIAALALICNQSDEFNVFTFETKDTNISEILMRGWEPVSVYNFS